MGLNSRLPDPLPIPSLPCRGLLCQSFPFVTGLANRRVLRSEEEDGGGKGLPGDGEWVCGVGMRGQDSLLNNVFVCVSSPPPPPNFLSKERKRSFMGNSSNSW